MGHHLSVKNQLGLAIGEVSAAIGICGCNEVPSENLDEIGMCDLCGGERADEDKDAVLRRALDRLVRLRTAVRCGKAR
jgi:hypothetical protein